VLPPETHRLALTALVFGTIAIALFLLPFGLYARSFLSRDEDQKSAGEKVFNTVVLHAAIILFVVIFSSFINVAIPHPEFKPSNGIKYFFGFIHSDAITAQRLSGGYLTPWDMWINKGSIGSGGSEIDAAMSNDVLIFFKFYAVALKFMFIAIPFYIVGYSLLKLSAFKKLDGDETNYESPTVKFLKSYSLMFFMIVLLHIHMLLASTYVQIYTTGEFSYAQILAKAWYEIIYGGAS
jgi:hypothetical protein